MERGTRVVWPAAGSTGGECGQRKYSDTPTCRARLRHSCRACRAVRRAQHSSSAAQQPLQAAHPARTPSTGPTSPSPRCRRGPGSAAPSPRSRPRRTGYARPTGCCPALPCPFCPSQAHETAVQVTEFVAFLKRCRTAERCTCRCWLQASVGLGQEVGARKAGLEDGGGLRARGSSAAGSCGGPRARRCLRAAVRASSPPPRGGG